MFSYSYRQPSDWSRGLQCCKSIVWLGRSFQTTFSFLLIATWNAAAVAAVPQLTVLHCVLCITRTAGVSDRPCFWSRPAGEASQWVSILLSLHLWSSDTRHCGLIIRARRNSVSDEPRSAQVSVTLGTLLNVVLSQFWNGNWELRETSQTETMVFWRLSLYLSVMFILI